METPWTSRVPAHLVRSFLLPIVLLLAGCGGGDRANLPPLEDLNVLLIVIDTLGAGHVGHLAGGLDTTPNLDHLAAEGVTFTRARSTAPWTQPAIASLLTGRTPSEHGVLHLFDKLGGHNTTLAEILGSRGFTTSGVVTHILLEPKLGFDQGFDRFDFSAIAGHDGVSSPSAAAIALEELRDLAGQRFFLMVHLFDPHSDYLHHPDFDRTSSYDGPVRDFDMEITKLRERRGELAPADVAFLRDLHREEIAFTDHHVGMILDELDRLGLEENTLVIVTADHGEEFMEHDWIGHTRHLYDTLVRVPLVFRLPGAIAPAVVGEPVSLLDIPATLGAMLEEPLAIEGGGRSLVPLLGSGKAEGPRAVFSEVAFLAPPQERGTLVAEKEAFKSAVTVEGWKLIHDLDEGTWELYDLAADPGEQDDLHDPDHAMVRDLRPILLDWEVGKVDAWGRRFKGLERMTDEERDRLRSLGYIR